jgi:hypothetical protein
MERLVAAFGCLLILQLGCCSKSPDDALLGTNCAMLTPCEIMDKRRLMKDMHLDNSQDVYQAVAELVARPETVEPPPSGYMPELSLIWESNPQADKKAFTIDLKQGMPVTKVLEVITARRRERLTSLGNYMAITSSAKNLLPTYRQQDINPSMDLKDAMGILLPVSIIILEPGDDDLSEFLTLHLQRTLRSTKEPSSFRFVTSDGAKRKMAKVNVIGNWFYQDLLEALGQVADLRWRIEGTEVHLRDAGEQ